MPKFSQELFDTICERISAGESLRKICKDKDMPSCTAVNKWLGSNPDLVSQYARAREAQADAFVDEMIGIADDANLDPQDRRVRIDTRKWLAGKLRPKVYGDKVQHEGPGEGGEFVHKIERVIVRSKPPGS